MSPTQRRREDGHRRWRRRHRPLRAIAAATTLLLLVLGSAVITVASSPSRTPNDARPRDVVRSLDPSDRPPGPSLGRGRADDVIKRTPVTPDVAWSGSPSHLDDSGRAVAALPPELASRPSAPAPEATPRSEAKPPPGRIRARGVATWYCLSGISDCHRDHGGGLYAAAGPALRAGAWRGRLVTVCAGERCVRVRLVDWCGCDGGRTGRVIDLYGDAFRRIAPLSLGEVRVSVRW